jgi:hypothetical protein
MYEILGWVLVSLGLRRVDLSEGFVGLDVVAHCFAGDLECGVGFLLS